VKPETVGAMVEGAWEGEYVTPATVGAALDGDAEGPYVKPGTVGAFVEGAETITHNKKQACEHHNKDTTFTTQSLKFIIHPHTYIFLHNGGK
jgi:hypothetical protein